MSIERVCRGRGRRDREPVRGPSRARRRDVGADAPRRARRRARVRSGLRVSGKSDFTAALHATADEATLPDADLVILATKATDVADAAARLAGRLPSATVMTIQNGLGAEEIVRAHGERPLVSAVTFMSGVRHSDAHVEYELDTETWLGPFAGHDDVRARAGDRGAARRVRAPRPRLPRPAAGPVVEADLQRDGEHGRGAHRPPARRRVRRASTSRPTSGLLVRDLMDEGKAVAAAAGVELHEDPWEMNVHAVQRGRDAGRRRRLRARPVDARGRALAAVRPRSTSSPARSSARRTAASRCRCTRRCTAWSRRARRRTHDRRRPCNAVFQGARR